MAVKERPPLPECVIVAWFWDPDRERWAIDDAQPYEPGMRELMTHALGRPFPHRHRYVLHVASKERPR